MTRVGKAWKLPALKTSMRLYSAIVIFLTIVSAHANLVITEVMAASRHTSNAIVDGDWWELTNTGTSAINLSGYKWDDTPTPTGPTVSTFPNVSIAAGESIIILQEAAANVSAWKTTWGLSTTQVINNDQTAAMGGEAFSGLTATGDEVNLYDPTGQLVASINFGASTAGLSQAFHPDGTAIYGLSSVNGRQGAYLSTQVLNDTASPGNAKIRFLSSPTAYGTGSYNYPISAVNPGFAAPTFTASGLPTFLTLTAGSGGTATLASNRALTLADAGNYLVSLTATSNSTSTIQDFIVTILNPLPSVILNEYNAVSATNFLNGGTAIADDDGGALSADSYFGRVIGNGGKWCEFVAIGNGTSGTMDLRNWKIEIGKNNGSGFAVLTTISLNTNANWQNVPTGTILTFIENNTALGGRDSGFAIRNNRNSLGDTWTNVWLGDTTYLTSAVAGTGIDNSGTQFRVKNASNQIVFGPAGEGIAPVAGTSPREVFELEGHPTTTVSPIITSNNTTQGYDDGASESTFGSPNNWLDNSTVIMQNFLPFSTSLFFQWMNSFGIIGNNALKTADADADGRNNFQEYAFGGNPAVADSGYLLGAVTAGSQVGWSYIRRNNDPSIIYSFESSENLSTWIAATPASTSTTAVAGASDFSRLTLQFNRPVPTPAKWFLRAKAE